MQYAPLCTTERPSSRVIFGTDFLRRSVIGSDSRCFRVLDEARDIGINTFESARSYGSEAVLGRWLRRRGGRSDIVLVTKGGIGEEVSARRLRDDCHRSLTALRSDHIDCYLVHYDSRSWHLADMVGELGRLLFEGKILSFGLSNFSLDRVRLVESHCGDKSIAKPRAVSAHFGLIPWMQPYWPNAQSLAGGDKQPERDWYRANGYRILGYSPLGRGYFRNREVGAGSDPYHDCRANELRFARARELGIRMGVSAAQIALAFVLCTGPEVFAIVGCRTLEHIRMCRQAAAIELTREEYSWLDLQEEGCSDPRC
jgi:aryl-alcohol dehydrogenase-like predicted oxidoreductase